MKGMAWLVVLVGVVLVAGCGGGEASQAAKDAAEASGAAFGQLFDDPATQACFTAQTAQQCDCPGGGAISVAPGTDNTMDFSFTGCTNAAGKTFTGTMTVDPAAGMLNASMSVFGDCANVTGSGPVGNVCSGGITGTCAGDTLSCSWTEQQDPQGATSCDLTC